MRIVLSRWVGLFLLAMVAVGVGGVAFAQDDLHVSKTLGTRGAPERVPDEFVVKFKAGVSESTIHQLNAQHGTHTLSASRFARFKRLRVSLGKPTEDLIDAYRRNPNVEYAEPNYLASALLTPDDPYVPMAPG